MFETFCFVSHNAVKGANGRVTQISVYSIFKIQLSEFWPPLKVNDFLIMIRHIQTSLNDNGKVHLCFIFLLRILHIVTLPDFFSVQFTDHEMRYIMCDPKKKELVFTIGCSDDL